MSRPATIACTHRIPETSVPDDQPPSALETLWVIRHAVQSLRLRRPLAAGPRLALAGRNLDPADCLYLLTRLAGLLPAPLAIGPPCSTERSHHERYIAGAIAALEISDWCGLERALQALAAPAGLTADDCRQAGLVVARLAGYTTGSSCTHPWKSRLAGRNQGFSP